MDTGHSLTNNSNPQTTNKDLDPHITLIGAVLDASVEEMRVTLRYDMKEKMVDVTLRVEPSQEYFREGIFSRKSWSLVQGSARFFPDPYLCVYVATTTCMCMKHVNTWIKLTDQVAKVLT